MKQSYSLSVPRDAEELSYVVINENSFNRTKFLTMMRVRTCSIESGEHLRHKDKVYAVSHHNEIYQTNGFSLPWYLPITMFSTRNRLFVV